MPYDKVILVTSDNSRQQVQQVQPTEVLEMHTWYLEWTLQLLALSIATCHGDAELYRAHATGKPLHMNVRQPEFQNHDWQA